MPAPIDVQFGGSGSDVAAIDQNGNLTLQGSATIGKYLALLPQAKAPQQVPGELLIYTLDGQSLTMISPSGAVTPITLGPTFAPVVVGPQSPVTGVTGIQTLATGIQVPAGSLAAGQLYRVVAWGQLTTTVDTQTVKFQLNYGTAAAGVSLLDFGTQNPNSGATVTGGAWRCEWDVEITGATTASTGGFNGPNFDPTTINVNSATGLAATSQAFTVCETPSASGLSVTLLGAYFQRIA